ncbi:MAG: hypothetical protein R2695_06280 [Acidimicrobiales bacterium]
MLDALLERVDARAHPFETGMGVDSRLVGLGRGNRRDGDERRRPDRAAAMAVRMRCFFMVVSSWVRGM